MRIRAATDRVRRSLVARATRGHVQPRAASTAGRANEWRTNPPGPCAPNHRKRTCERKRPYRPYARVPSRWRNGHSKRCASDVRERRLRSAPSACWLDGGEEGNQRGRRAGQAEKLFEGRLLQPSKGYTPLVEITKL
ncbi:hypothetical protein C0Z20_26960 [Trinickia symbiotica]|uniref:Uncharacterized protein n=1 Tax=Trinickia symbiotica TaxID=863227 RepID=A0A2N7WRQ0_9BURK|nr:hypothetical protein C0Z20_26960 [Trinickia symbiotica]